MSKIVEKEGLMTTTYHQEKDNDGFLYIKYSKENVFG